MLLRRTIRSLVSTGHRVTLLAPAAPAAVLVGPGEVAEALPWDGPEMAALLAGDEASPRLGPAIASADAVVAFTRSEHVREALGRHARRLVTRDPAPPPGGPHASLWLAGALEGLGLPAGEDPGPLAFTDAERVHAEAATSGLPAGFLAVHPGSGSPAKNWPFARFVEAARRLAAGRRWLLVLGPAEEHLVPASAPFTLRASIEESPSLPGAVVARGLPLRRIAAVLARAGLFLGNDSGLAHTAAACGTTTLALFGPTEPAQWAPVGPAVRTLRAPSGRMEDLGLDEVVAAARRVGR